MNSSGDDAFPSTHWSLISGARDRGSSRCRESLEELARRYWRPVYAFVRRKWTLPHEDAKDVTQEFFAALCEKDMLDRLAPEHGKFRSFLMAVLDHFVVSKHRRESRLKRGGGVRVVPLDIEKGFEPAGDGSPEEIFQIEWARSVLAEALRRLEIERRGSKTLPAYEILRLRDVDKPPGEDVSYKALAKRFGIAETQVTNILHEGRRRLRELVLELIRETVASEREAESEMKDLFGRRT